jgi:Bacterial aa3 type cytochrome c oxidase subunit IV
MASGNDMKAAERTYSGFIGLIKWTIPVIAVLVLLVLMLIS